MSGVLRKFKRQNGDHLSTGDREVRDALRRDLASAEERLGERLSLAGQQSAEALTRAKLQLEERVFELEAKLDQEREARRELDRAWQEMQATNERRFDDLYWRLGEEAAARERADSATITAWLRRVVAAAKRITFRALRIRRAV